MELVLVAFEQFLIFGDFSLPLFDDLFGFVVAVRNAHPFGVDFQQDGQSFLEAQFGRLAVNLG